MKRIISVVAIIIALAMSVTVGQIEAPVVQTIGVQDAQAHNDWCSGGTLTVIYSDHYEYWGCNVHLHFNNIGALVWVGAWEKTYDSRWYGGGGCGTTACTSGVGPDPA